jgi:hypothetical protein
LVAIKWPTAKAFDTSAALIVICPRAVAPINVIAHANTSIPAGVFMYPPGVLWAVSTNVKSLLQQFLHRGFASCGEKRHP